MRRAGLRPAGTTTVRTKRRRPVWPRRRPRFFVVKLGQSHTRQRPFERLFDGGELRLFLAIHQRKRIAGMAMAGDPGLRQYPGGVPLNTYHFFGRHAISVGSSKVPEGGEMVTRFDEASGRYLKAIFSADTRLTGIYGVNEFFDGGVMCQLILRRIDLTAVKERFLAAPMKVGREIMSSTWR